MQAVLRTIFPSQCVACSELVDSDHGLCGTCWRDAHFIQGCICDQCGVPLPGGDAHDHAICDDCLSIPRPWSRGRAVFQYRDSARRMVLGFKHGDRTELARPLGDWLARAAAPLLVPDMLVVPIPLHRWRLFRRRYNQAALLSQRVARLKGLAHCPDMLIRTRLTETQDGKGASERFANLEGGLQVHPRHRGRVAGRVILLVDDVMTSGATFSAGAQALLDAGAAEVRVAMLARVAKEP